MTLIKNLISLSKNEISKNREDPNYIYKLDLIKTIENHINNNENILWYPSSFSDFNDLLYYNNDRLDMLQDNDPILYIHTDILDNISLQPERNYYNTFGQHYYSFNISMDTSLESGSRSITFSEFSLGGKNFKYKINLFGFSNNDILEMFMNSGLFIKYLFTTMTNEQLQTNIEPHYYFQFYDILQIKFHVGTFLEYFGNIEIQNSKVRNFLKLQNKEIREKVLSKLIITEGEIANKYKVEIINKDDKIRFLGHYNEILKCRFII